MPTVGSLFSGIGGMDLGLERAGWEVRWQVENDKYCNQVLEKHWPDVRRYGDIKAVDPGGLERVDLICGGFPCQPWSVAGRGDGESDDRNLWPDTVRVIRGVRPRLVLLENVPGILTHEYFGTILGDLAESGYDAEWDCIPAAAVGAPHLRYRLFIVAYSRRFCGEWRGVFTEGSTWQARGEPNTRRELVADSERPQRRTDDVACRAERQHMDAPREEGSVWAGTGCEDVADTTEQSEREQTDEANTFTGGWQPRPEFGSGSEQMANAHGETNGHGERGTCEAFRNRPQGSRHHVPTWWAVEPDVGRVADGIPARVDRLKGLGNAVVPQVAEWIGRRLLDQ